MTEASGRELGREGAATSTSDQRTDLVDSRSAPPDPPLTHSGERGRGQPWYRGLSRQDWFVGALFAIATALLSAGIGVLADLVAGIASDESKPVVCTRLWTFLALTSLGGILLLVAVLLWRRERIRLRDRGTLYVIEEEARGWTREERKAWLAKARGHFAEVLRVPGPGELGRQWDWSLGQEAGQWDDRLGDLVRSFWAVHHNDDEGTVNCVMVRAGWPVAWAFTQRAVGARRGLDLRVLRIPSYGRGGKSAADPAADALVFDADPVSDQTPRSEQAVTFRHRAKLTIDPATADEGEGGTKPAVVLLVRMTSTSWGPIAPDAGGESAESVSTSADMEIGVKDAAGTGMAAACHPVEVREWRRLPAGKEHDAAAFPGLARDAFAWLLSAAAEYSDHVVLVGLIVPQEVSAGFGLLAAQNVIRLPARLWPLVRPFQPTSAGGRLPDFVIPNLNLGRAQ